MTTPPEQCAHRDVEARGVSPSYGATWSGSPLPGMSVEYEYGQCMTCESLVQRELGGTDWTLMPGQGRGA
jgi:hypothetical protein